MSRPMGSPASVALARGRFADLLHRHGVAPLLRARVDTLQVNLGKLCNQACHHCHVDAGPGRREVMPEHVMDEVLRVIRRNPCLRKVDITGGAPELNPRFRKLVAEAHRLERDVIDRCNLTVLFQQGMEDLPAFLAAHRVRIVASLPCYGPENVDRQRGRGVFDQSIAALRVLNALDYGREGSALRLDLVYNPVGASLPPPQPSLEASYREELARRFGIAFHRLLTITNMPIGRLATQLERLGRFGDYMGLLVNHFNPETVQDLMCRTLVSVGWDGRLHDCDFNQMLEIGLGAGRETGIRTIGDVDRLDALEFGNVATGDHCLGCTAGAGSSCGGAIR